jgi:hypothetical protein
MEVIIALIIVHFLNIQILNVREYLFIFELRFTANTIPGRRPDIKPLYRNILSASVTYPVVTIFKILQCVLNFSFKPSVPAAKMMGKITLGGIGSLVHRIRQVLIKCLKIVEVAIRASQ